jgi:hypothetical protein
MNDENIEGMKIKHPAKLKGLPPVSMGGAC